MRDVFDKCSAFKDDKIAKATGLYPYFRPIEASHGSTEVDIEGRRVIMVGSNNYLGLAGDPRVKEAAIEAIRRFGSTCSGSRLLNGTLVLHEELESRLAKFLQRESALVCSTGFQTNVATVSAILGRHDIVFTDRQNHASLVDGVRLGFAEEKRYRHQDMGHLESMLEAADPDAGKIIITDGVFSMEGDLCNLPKIVELAQKYHARVMTDDAHSMGVLGAHGRGTAEYFGLEAQTDLVMGTFSKSFASLGGVIAGPYRRHQLHQAPCPAGGLQRVDDPGAGRLRAEGPGHHRGRAAAAGPAAGHRREDAQRLPRHGLRHRRLGHPGGAGAGRRPGEVLPLLEGALRGRRVHQPGHPARRWSPGTRCSGRATWPPTPTRSSTGCSSSSRGSAGG